MRDLLHEYNVRVHQARIDHRDTMQAVTADYEEAIRPIVETWRDNMAAAARRFHQAMTAAEDDYQHAVVLSQSEPQF